MGTNTELRYTTVGVSSPVSHATPKYLSPLITGPRPDVYVCVFYLERANQTAGIVPPLVSPCKTQVIFVRSSHIYIVETLMIFNKVWLCCYVGVGSFFCSVESWCDMMSQWLWHSLKNRLVLSVILLWFILLVQTSVWSGYHQPSVGHLCTSPLVFTLW